MNSLNKYFVIFVIPFVWLRIVYAATNYVWQGSPSPAAPYTTWETAAHVIQDAVDVAVSGNVVLVTNGVYTTGGGLMPNHTLQNRVVITNTIYLVSINGPKNTIIMGKEDLVGTMPVSNGVRGVYMAGGARLEGFTIKNGCTETEGLRKNHMGGGIYFDKQVMITNCVITNCMALTAGGGIYGDDQGYIESCIIIDNSAEGDGGGICIDDNALVRNNIIRNNDAITGGGIYVGGESVVINSVISNNTAYKAGGIYSYNNGEVVNCFIYDNKAETWGGGIGLQRGSILSYSTVVGNHAIQSGGGIDIDDDAQANNSIIYYNTTEFNKDNWYGTDEDSSFINCCIYPLDNLPNNINCIDTEPGLVGAGNPHILPVSACVDSGTNIVAPGHDIDMDPRIVGTNVDIGCDEVTNLTGLITAVIQIPANTVTVNQAISCNSGIKGKATYYVWEIDTGGYVQQITNAYRITLEWQIPGAYDVILTAHNAENHNSATATVYVVSKEAAVTYVSLSGMHISPFTNWVNAATNIQTAVDACVYGGTVIVTNGIYSSGVKHMPFHVLANRVVIDKPITVFSVNGPGHTIISGAQGTGDQATNAVRCVFLTQGGLLSGFTLENGGTLNYSDNDYDMTGGGILLRRDAVLTNCTVRFNSTGGQGGGCFCEKTAQIVDCIISNNAGKYGGGVYLYSGGTILHTYIEKNDGRGIISDTGGDILNCTVIGNLDGGICNDYGGDIRNCIVTRNTTDDGGGGILNYASGIIADSIICSNMAEENGGGIRSNFDTIITNCYVYGNHARRAGGIYMANGGEITRCTSLNNTADDDCGGLMMIYDVTARWCRITGNTADDDAGGVYCQHGCVLENMVIRDNSGYNGGGIYCHGANTIKNSIISDNHARNNGGGILGDNDYVIWNCSVTYNSAQSSGGGIFCDGDGEMGNTILYYNTAQFGGNNWTNNGKNISFSHCVTHPTNNLPNAQACIENEPGIVGICNPHILPGSVCIDAGTNILTGGFDIDNEPRIVGTYIDIGCDELTNLTGEIIARIHASSTNTTIHQTETFISAIEGKAGGFTWTINTGSGIQVITNTISVQCKWDTPGFYPIVLDAWNDTDYSSMTVTVRVVSYDESITYVSPFGGNVWPFTSWANAATTIQSAVDACINGGTVMVTNGIYSTGGVPAPDFALQNRVSASKPITIQSVNGPEATFIIGAPHSYSEKTGSNAVRGVYLAEGATLAGFTVSNGSTMQYTTYRFERSGGGIFLMMNGYVTNCMVVGNFAEYCGGGIFCAQGGTIRNSTISGNTVLREAGGIYCDYGGTVINCKIRNNTSERDAGGVYCNYGGIVRHSWISRNSAERDGGGVICNRGGNVQTSIVNKNCAREDGGGVHCYFGGTVLQCTILDNYAEISGGGTYCDNGALIQNTIIYYNTAGSIGSNSRNRNADIYYKYCCTTPVSELPNETACIEAEPLLAGLDNPHIVVDSPCINAGTNTATAILDIDGDPRIADDLIDIGCDEVTNLIGSLQAAIDITNTTVSIYQPVILASAISGKVTEYIWIVETETGSLLYTNNIIVSNIWVEPGYYDVMLTAYNLSTSSVALITVYVYSLEEETVYVSLAGNHTWPFSTWATASTNIQSAIRTAQDGFTVMVTNGIYNVGGDKTPENILSNRIVLTGAVTVRSVNGPEATVIEGSPDPGSGSTGQDAVRCAYLSEGAILSGFTLSNGYTYAYGTYIYDKTGGGVLLDEGGIVTNCIIVKNTSAKDGGGVSCNNGGKVTGSRICSNTAQENGGGVMCMATGTIEQCAITGNKAVSYSGGGIYCNQGGVVRNCIINDNIAEAHSGGGLYCFMGGLVRGCVIYSNTATRFGGGIMCTEGGILENCTISDNTSDQDGGGVYTYLGGAVRNCIVYFNSVGLLEGNWFSVGDGSIYEYSCTTPTNSLPGGVGCTSEEPQFENAAATNFYLLESSPCINAGTNMAWMIGAIDIAGTPRIKDGRVDMGAYEFIPEPASGVLIVTFLLYSIRRKRI